MILFLFFVGVSLFLIAIALIDLDRRLNRIEERVKNYEKK